MKFFYFDIWLNSKDCRKDLWAGPLMDPSKVIAKDPLNISPPVLLCKDFSAKNEMQRQEKCLL